jgi:hypothetical protein
MNAGGPLINLGDLTKPATVLIEKISDAVGTLYLPRKIKRVAAAEAEAEKIRALAAIEISDIQRRALVRLIEDEGKKQGNIEQISAQAIRNLDPDAKPENIDNDWLAHFFDRCKLVSEAEMQSLWARLLASEANQPGTFSKRTIEAVAALSKADAELFTLLCRFCCLIGGQSAPVIFDHNADFYRQCGIKFGVLKHLEDIGLISYSLTGHAYQHIPQHFEIRYGGNRICFEFSNPSENELRTGEVLLTSVGLELEPIAGAAPFDGFESYMVSQWIQDGVSIYSPWPKN